MSLFEWFRRDESKIESTTLAALIHEYQMEDAAEVKRAFPEWKGNWRGWSRRTRCDECRGLVVFLNANVCVPNLTPILCSVCAGMAWIRTKWRAA